MNWSLKFRRFHLSSWHYARGAVGFPVDSDRVVESPSLNVETSEGLMRVCTLEPIDSNDYPLGGSYSPLGGLYEEGRIRNSIFELNKCCQASLGGGTVIANPAIGRCYTHFHGVYPPGATVRDAYIEGIFPFIMDAELQGLGGDFEVFNGEHRLILVRGSGYLSFWVGAFVYEGSPFTNPFFPQIRGHIASGETPEQFTLTIRMMTEYHCYKRWKKEPPDLEGNWEEDFCEDDGCIDSDTCTKSAGATCKTKAAGSLWPE